MSHNNFLRLYQTLNSGTEIPEDFALWCGISGVSAALGRRVYLDEGIFILYPNFFVVLVASSGRCRKSTAIGIIHRILQDSTPPFNLIAQKTTPEALIQKLKTNKSIGNEDTPIPKRTISQGVSIVDELANLINKHAIERNMDALLINLFDCSSTYTHHTKTSGEEVLKDCCLTLLGGTTPKSLRENLPRSIIGGGLTSRIMWILVETPNPPVPRPKFGPEKVEALRLLKIELARLRALSGPFTFTPEADRFFDEWYFRWCEETGKPLFNDPLLDGYATRRDDHMKKLAMILSAIEGDTLVVTKENLIGADELLLMVERNMPKVLGLISTSDKGGEIEFVLSTIQKSGTIARSELLRKVQHRGLDAFGLSKITETLIASGQIGAKHGQSGSINYEAM